MNERKSSWLDFIPAVIWLVFVAGLVVTIAQAGVSALLRVAFG